MFSLSGRLLFQKDDRFEVMSLREHIQRLNCPNKKSLTDKFLQISAQGGWIATDVDDSLAGQAPRQPGQSAEAPARRVTDDGSKDFTFGGEIPAG